MTAHLSHTVAREGQVVLHARGDLDLAAAPHLASGIDTLVRAGARRIVLDLTSADFVDSTVINLVVRRLRALRDIGGDIVVATGDERIARPFTVTGATVVVAVVGTVKDALGAVAIDSARTRRASRAAGPAPRRVGSRELSGAALRQRAC